MYLACCFCFKHSVQSVAYALQRIQLVISGCCVPMLGMLAFCFDHPVQWLHRLVKAKHNRYVVSQHAPKIVSSHVHLYLHWIWCHWLTHTYCRHEFLWCVVVHFGTCIDHNVHSSRLLSGRGWCLGMQSSLFRRLYFEQLPCWLHTCRYCTAFAVQF